MVQYKMMNSYQRKNEKEDLLMKIGMLDFTLVDLGEFLDTHPDNQEALGYFEHFSKNLKLLEKEYTMKYGPLKMEDMGNGTWDTWKWSTEPMPWEPAMN